MKNVIQVKRMVNYWSYRLHKIGQACNDKNDHVLSHDIIIFFFKRYCEICPK
jgi:hypothetical protein